MSIVGQDSVIYLVVTGQHMGQKCVVRSEGDTEGSVGVVFFDQDADRIVIVDKGILSQFDIPGWPDAIEENTYGLKEHFGGRAGCGANMLRFQSWVFQEVQVKSSSSQTHLTSVAVNPLSNGGHYTQKKSPSTSQQQVKNQSIK